MRSRLSEQTIARLCSLDSVLAELIALGTKRVSSAQLARLTGTAAHNIRKDLCSLGEIGAVGAGYETARLRAYIRESLCLDRQRKACVVGLGRLGSAVLEYERLRGSGIVMAAGFDSNINRLETIRTQVEVHPAYMIPDVVRTRGIELGVIAVPAQAAQETADRLVEGGIRGIINFAPFRVRVDSRRVIVTNMDVEREFGTLSARIALCERGEDVSGKLAAAST